MKKLALIAALLLAASTSAFAQNWYYSNDFGHTEAYVDDNLPINTYNVNGQIAFNRAPKNEAINGAGPAYQWVKTSDGTDVTSTGTTENTGLRLIRTDATKRLYWDGDWENTTSTPPITGGNAYIPSAIANQGNVNTYAVEMRFKVDALSAVPTAQNQGIVFFQGYSEITPLQVSSGIVGNNGVRLVMARGKRAGDGGTGNQWSEIQDPGTSNKFFIYDYFKNLDYWTGAPTGDPDKNKGAIAWDPSSYIECNIGEWYTLKIVQSVANFDQYGNYKTNTATTDIWLNGSLVQHWTGKQLFLGAGNREVSFGYNNSKGVTSDITFDYLKIGTVPEPGSILAMASGLVGLAGFAIRKRH